LHEPAERGVQISVVEEIVGHLVEQCVGVEIEPALGSVPARVPEPALVAVTSSPKAHRENRIGSGGELVLSLSETWRQTP
jgi:hypothetical protein